MITLRFTGIKELDTAAMRAASGAFSGATKAASKQTRAIFKTSQFYCPVDTKRLKKSGRIEGPNISGHRVTFTIAYGGVTVAGKDVDYAVVVHEDPTKHHAAPTRHKFVEVAFVENNVHAYDVFRQHVWREIVKAWR